MRKPRSAGPVHPPTLGFIGPLAGDYHDSRPVLAAGCLSGHCLTVPPVPQVPTPPHREGRAISDLPTSHYPNEAGGCQTFRQGEIGDRAIGIITTTELGKAILALLNWCFYSWLHKGCSHVAGLANWCIGAGKWGRRRNTSLSELGRQLANKTTRLLVAGVHSTAAKHMPHVSTHWPLVSSCLSHKYHGIDCK
jgi:hypothetical protein